LPRQRQDDQPAVAFRMVAREPRSSGMTWIVCAVATTGKRIFVFQNAGFRP
jgi:hypothetical protein